MRIWIGADKNQLEATMYDNEEVISAMQDWMQKKRVPPNDEVTQLILEKVLKYLEGGDVVSVSHFERSYSVLCSQGRIKPFAGALGTESAATPAAAQADVPLTADEYNRMSAQEVQRKYKQNPKFHADVDLLISQGKV